MNEVNEGFGKFSMKEIVKSLNEVASALDDQPTVGHLRAVSKRIASISIENLRGELLILALNVAISTAELANYFDQGNDGVK